MHLGGHLCGPKISKNEENLNDINLVSNGKYKKRAKNGVFEGPPRPLGTDKNGENYEALLIFGKNFDSFTQSAKKKFFNPP